MRILFALLLIAGTARADVVSDYEAAWDAGDLAAMESLFTPKAWRRWGDNYARVFAKTTERDLDVSGTVYETNRRFFGRTVYVVALRGVSNMPDRKRNVSSVIGLEVNRHGVIRKLREIHVDPNLSGIRTKLGQPVWLADRISPEEYAALWPTVQAQAQHMSLATAGDAITTACAIARVGTGSEANPIARVVFGLGPVPGAIVWFTGADSITHWVLERDYWYGNGPLPPGQWRGMQALKWGIVANNLAVCLG